MQLLFKLNFARFSSLRWILFVVSGIFLLCSLSCASENEFENTLPGNWRAYNFIQQGDTATFDLSRLSFSFSEKGTYRFIGANLSLQEAGNYYLNRNILYTKDTLTDNALEKAVELDVLSTDTVHFIMNAGGIDQRIELYKVD